MIDQKILWEKLAKENARYYIHTDKGRKITEKEFIRSGLEDTTKYVFNDDLMPKGGTLLEIGCGNGRMIMFFSPLFDKVIGTDISSEMIRQGKKRIGGFENIELIETDGNLIPNSKEENIASDCIDVVFSMHVFQHIKKREMIEANMKEIYRVLKRNGIGKLLFQIGTPNSTTSWWSGVELNETDIRELCKQFTILKMEEYKHGTIWVWLKKI